MHLESKVNDYLLELEKWLHQNKLMLNISKSKYKVFQPINKSYEDDINIFFKKQRLEQVKTRIPRSVVPRKFVLEYPYW